MARGDNQINLRVKDDLKARVVASAKANNRSINAEVCFQLQRAYYQTPLWGGKFVPFKASEIEQMQQQVELDRMAGN